MEAREAAEDYLNNYSGMFGVQPISADELGKGNFVIVDARNEEEMGVSVIPGAIPLDSFESQKDSFRDKDIVFYCTAGLRSGKACAKYKGEGFKVRNHSLFSYAAAPGTVLVDPTGKPASRIHGVSPSFAKCIPPQYKPVYFERPLLRLASDMVKGNLPKPIRTFFKI